MIIILKYVKMHHLQDNGTVSGSDDEATQQDDDIDNLAPASNVIQVKGRINWSFHIYFMFPQNSGRKKNENIFKPVKLSGPMMEVFETNAKYQEPNDVRKLLAKYKKKLQVFFKHNHFVLSIFSFKGCE